MLKLLNMAMAALGSDPDQRGIDDRRVAPTRPFSRYWLRGRRRSGRRDDEASDIYVDRYSAGEWFLVIGLFVLCTLDMVFTLQHLDAGGTEANPIMDWTLQWGGQLGFQVVKMATTILGLFVLLLHVRFRRVRSLLTFAFAIYAALFVFHLYLTTLR